MLVSCTFFLAHILIMLYVYIESEYKIVSTLNLYTIPFMVILLCLYIIFRKKEKKLYSELFLIIAKQLRNIVIEIPDNMDEMNKQ